MSNLEIRMRIKVAAALFMTCIILCVPVKAGSETSGVSKIVVSCTVRQGQILPFQGVVVDYAIANHGASDVLIDPFWFMRGNQSAAISKSVTNEEIVWPQIIISSSNFTSGSVVTGQVARSALGRVYWGVDEAERGLQSIAAGQVYEGAFYLALALDFAEPIELFSKAGDYEVKIRASISGSIVHVSEPSAVIVLQPEESDRESSQLESIKHLSDEARYDLHAPNVELVVAELNKADQEVIARLASSEVVGQRTPYQEYAELWLLRREAMRHIGNYLSAKRADQAERADLQLEQIEVLCSAISEENGTNAVGVEFLRAKMRRDLSRYVSAK